MIRVLMIVAALLAISVSGCGKKAPLDPPPDHAKKEKPAP